MILRATQSGHLTASRDPGQVETRQPLAARRREPILAASGGAPAGRPMDFDPSQIRKGLIGAVVLLGTARIAFPVPWSPVPMGCSPGLGPGSSPST